MALWADKKKKGIQQLEQWSEKKDCSRRQLVANYALHQHKTSSANEITHNPSSLSHSLSSTQHPGEKAYKVRGHTKFTLLYIKMTTPQPGVLTFQ